jgi:Tfp pilus assembly protein PilF
MVRDAPGSFRAEWTEAEFARQQGDLRSAEVHLRRSVQIHPLGWHVWRNLATLMYVEGRYVEAAQYFTAAWKINGGSAVDAQRAVQANLQAGRIDSAAAFLKEAVAKRPSMPVELTLAASDVALARGEFLRAMTLRQRAAWDFPDSARYWALTGAAAVRAVYCPEVLHALGRLRGLPTGVPFVAPLERNAQELRCR